MKRWLHLGFDGEVRVDVTIGALLTLAILAVGLLVWAIFRISYTWFLVPAALCLLADAAMGRKR